MSNGRANESVTIDFEDEPPYQSKMVRREASSDAERLRDFIVAANDGTSPGAMWSIFDPDIEFHVPPDLPYGGSFRGLAAVKQAHAATRDHYDRIRTEIEQIVCSGDLAIMYFQFNFRARKNGRTGSFPMIETFRLAGGKVIEWRGFHFAPGAIAAILGAEA
jgi:ketosteroid isomerase-like protein